LPHRPAMLQHDRPLSATLLIGSLVSYFLLSGVLMLLFPGRFLRTLHLPAVSESVCSLLVSRLEITLGSVFLAVAYIVARRCLLALRPDPVVLFGCAIFFTSMLISQFSSLRESSQLGVANIPPYLHAMFVCWLAYELSTPAFVGAADNTERLRKAGA